MRIKNIPNVSESWLNAAKSNTHRKNKPNEFSVTQLIGSPRIYYLSQIFDSDIELPLEDYLDSILGTAMHEYLAKYTPSTSITELEIHYPITVDGKEYIIHGRPDEIALVRAGEWKLIDFKIVSVWNYILGMKPEYIAQQNWYREMIQNQLGFNITSMQLDERYKDWSLTNKLKGNGEYPIKKLLPVAVPEWEREETITHMQERIRLFINAENMSADDLPPCTEEERWVKNSAWKVYKLQKNGVPGKRAVKGGAKFQTEEDAEEFMLEKENPNEYVTKYNAGEEKRCTRYCPVRYICEHGRTLAGLAGS